MTDRKRSIHSGYLGVAEQPSPRKLTLLLSEVSDSCEEASHLMGWILAHCPEIQDCLGDLDSLRELYGLEPTAGSLLHAFQLRSFAKLALGPLWDSAEILSDQASEYPRRALATASEEVFGCEFTEVAPLEEILRALEATEPEAHASRRRELKAVVEATYQDLGER